MHDDRLTEDYTRRLASLLRIWCQGEQLSFPDERWFIDQLVAIVLSNRLCAIRLRAAGLAQGVAEIHDVARDYLAEPLARNSGNSLALLLADALNESDAFVLRETRRLLVTVTLSNLFHRWRESDPIGASVHDCLWNELRNHPERYILLPDDRTAPRYVGFRRDGNVRENRPKITREDIVRLIASVWKGTHHIPPCVHEVLTIVSEDDRWCTLVPIYEVLFEGLCEVGRLGIMRAEEIRIEKAELGANGMKEDVRRVFEACLKETLPYMQSIIEKYSEHGKISAATAHGMKIAAAKLLGEFGLDGIRGSGFKDALLQSCADLRESEYDADTKFKFQYVMGLAFDRLDASFKKRWTK